MMTEKRKREKAAYRARRREAGVRYTVADLIARGEHLCHACGEEVDVSLEARRAGDPRSASVDHKIPLSAAHGDPERLRALNRLENLALAHKVCNQAHKGETRTETRTVAA